MSNIVLLRSAILMALSFSFCHSAVLLDHTLRPPVPDPKGTCEYLGEYYKPGIISTHKDGDCESVVTCVEGGGVMVSDSIGCVRGIYKVLTTGGLENKPRVYGSEDDDDDTLRITTLPPLYS